MSKFYHNPRRDVWNKPSVVDFMDNYKRGDKIYYSNEGCALVFPLSEDDIKKMRKAWLESYK